jgi:hypothetical protein
MDLNSDDLDAFVDFEDSGSETSKDSWAEFFPKKAIAKPQKKKPVSKYNLMGAMKNCIELQEMRPDMQHVIDIISAGNH